MLLLLLFLVACEPITPLAPPHCVNTTHVRLPTQDGAEVALHRHPGHGPPVLLIHGISSNRHFWDLTEEHSLAVILAEAGMDAWVLDLRGLGDAEKKADGSKQRHGWTVDDYGNHDLHAAIEHIRSQTRYQKIAVVGHSMGGMVAAAYHGHHGDDALSALVVVGSPIVFDSKTFLMRMNHAALQVGSLWKNIGSEKWARLAAKLPGDLPIHGEGILFTAKNMSIPMRRYMLQRIVSPVSREELAQFHQILKAGRFVSADGDKDYANSLASLDIPILVIAGAGDKVAPLPSVSAWMTYAGSADETLVTVSEANGYAADYGHLDLVLGDAARSEVLNPITTWLEDRLKP
jgi:oxygen-independent coproporphyrinogen-3 oxidase